MTVADKDGLMVPRSKNRIRFEIEGPGEIVAVDNGDATSHESFQSKEYNAYNGLCLVIVRTKAAKPGPSRSRPNPTGWRAPPDCKSGHSMQLPEQLHACAR